MWLLSDGFKELSFVYFLTFSHCWDSSGIPLKLLTCRVEVPSLICFVLILAIFNGETCFYYFKFSLILRFLNHRLLEKWLFSGLKGELSVQFSHSVLSNSLRPHELRFMGSLSITNSWSLLKFMSIK